MVVCLRAAQGGRLRDFALAGALLSATTLVRPAFVLLPFFLAIARADPRAGRSARAAALGGWAALALVAALTLAPWFTYNYVYLGRFTLSPAGGIGRGTVGRHVAGALARPRPAELTKTAETDRSRRARSRACASRGQRRHLPADADAATTSTSGVTSARSGIRPTDPMERARARVVADQEYLRAALAHIREDPVGTSWRRVTRGTVHAVGGRHSRSATADINARRRSSIRAIWLAQVLVLAVAAGRR